MSGEADRCGAPTTGGDPCRAWPVEGSTRCVVHQDHEPEREQEDAGDDRCGAPTTRGGLCRNHRMGGSDRCHLHVGMDPTEAREEAWHTGPLKHGYFVTGFLDDEEKELFARVLEGTTDVGALKQQVIAALVVRANRMTRWEAEGQPISGFATEVFGELRKALESITPDELRVQHTWDTAEVAAQVEHVLAHDRELLIRLLPPEIQDTVREALKEAS